MFLGDAQDAFRNAVKKGLMEELVCTNTLIQPEAFLRKKGLSESLKEIFM
jgi:hypothetical protein